MGGTRSAQIAIDQQRPNAFGLGQQPRKIQRGHRLPFTDTGAGQNDRAYLLVFASLQYASAQGAKLFVVSRTRLRDSHKMRFDARRGNRVGHEFRGTRRPGSAQSCPSSTRSDSVGECRPVGRIRSVRSGR